MNLKILCRSFEARTKPYQIKHDRIKIGQEMTREVAFFIDFEPGRTDARTDAHTHVRSPLS